MKHLKTFEKVTTFDIKYFLDKYNDFNNGNYFLNQLKSKDVTIYSIYKNFNFPEEIKNELYILIFLYNNTYSWKTGYEKDDNYIKRKVKEYIQKIILDKIQKNPNIYFEIKKIVDKYPNFNNSGSFGYLSNSTIRYILFLLNSIERKTPNYIKDTNKYNL